ADCWSDATLRGEEAKHLVQVLRIKAGETVTVFDGHGRRATARVINCQRDHVLLEIGEAETPEPPKPHITLALAIPKGKNMDLIVQKAVELGVARIQPLITRHTIVQPGEGKADKWRRTALEACKQCGQDTLPEIAEARPFDRWLADPQPAHLKLIASLAAGARPLRETLSAHPDVGACTLLIGPEGDFSAEETHAALATGFLPISLGRIVLRVETAAFYALSALRYAYS
ncbi:MAG TPA: 16S rRNA (uracil(1498)-N(3))-methyltransferase, partial [Luteolibacter sp.]|nr:16S rRNA (uracil(1498)-N(3))-methyltransferase [Luteolibacter sp.]